MNTVLKFRGIAYFLFMFFGLLTPSCGSKVLLTCADGTSDCQAIESKFLGSWKMVHVSCDGAESTVMTDAALKQDNVTTQYNWDTGNRTFVIGQCTVTIPYTAIIYSDSTVTITEGKTECDGDCAAFAGPCKATGSSVTYPYQNTGSQLVFDVPQTANATDPCNSNWSKNVRVYYSKVQ